MERPNRDVDDDDDFQQFVIKPRTAARADCSAAQTGRRMKSVKSQENPFAGGDSPTLSASTAPSRSRLRGGESSPAFSAPDGVGCATDRPAACFAAKAALPPAKRRRTAAAVCVGQMRAPSHDGVPECGGWQRLPQQPPSAGHALGPAAEPSSGRPTDCSELRQLQPPAAAQPLRRGLPPEEPLPLPGLTSRRLAVTVGSVAEVQEEKEESVVRAASSTIGTSDAPSDRDCTIIRRQESEGAPAEPSHSQEFALLLPPLIDDQPAKSTTVAKTDKKRFQKTTNGKQFDCPMCGRIYKIEKIAHTAKCIPKVALDNVGALVKKLEKAAGSGTASNTRRSKSLAESRNGALLSVKSTAPERFTKSVKLNAKKKIQVASAASSVDARTIENTPHLLAEERNLKSSEAGNSSRTTHKVTRQRRKSTVKAAGNSAEDRPLLLQLEPTVVRQLLEARLHELLASAGRCSQATYTPALLRTRVPLRPQSAAVGDSDLETVAARQPRLWDLATMHSTDHGSSTACHVESNGTDCAAGTQDFSAYYVRSLMPPLSPCKVKAGSKLKEWSTIPGRKEEAVLEAKDDKRSPKKELDRSSCVDGGAAIFAACDDELRDRLVAELLAVTPEGYEHMVGNSLGSDLTLLAADGEIPCHSFIMASKYPGLLKTVAATRCLSLNNVRKADILQWLKFLYTGQQTFARSLSPATIAAILHVIRASTDTTGDNDDRISSSGDLRQQKSHPEPATAATTRDAVTRISFDEVPTPGSPMCNTLPSVLPASPSISMPGDDRAARHVRSSGMPRLDLEAISTPVVDQLGGPLSRTLTYDRSASSSDSIAATAAATTVVVASPLMSCSAVAPLTSSPFTPVSIESDLPSPRSIPVIDVGHSPEVASISDVSRGSRSGSPAVLSSAAVDASARLTDECSRIVPQRPDGLDTDCTSLSAMATKSGRVPAAPCEIGDCIPLLPGSLPKASTPFGIHSRSGLPSTPASSRTQVPRKTCGRLLSFEDVPQGTSSRHGTLPSPVRSVERLRRSHGGSVAAHSPSSRSPDFWPVAQQYSLSLIGSPSSRSAVPLHTTSSATISTSAVQSAAVNDSRASQVCRPAPCSPVVIDSDWSADAFGSSPEPCPSLSPHDVRQQSSGPSAASIEQLIPTCSSPTKEGASLHLLARADSDSSQRAFGSGAGSVCDRLVVSACSIAMPAVVTSSRTPGRTPSPVIDLTQASPTAGDFDSDCCFPLDDESDLDAVLSEERPSCGAIEPSRQVTGIAVASCTNGSTVILSALPSAPDRLVAAHSEPLPVAAAVRSCRSSSPGAPVYSGGCSYPADNDLDFDDSFTLEDAENLVSEPETIERRSAVTLVPPRPPPAATPAQPMDRHPPAVPSPFTPMPTYSTMDTPLLKREVSKYGVKPQLSKKRMIALLQDIYRQTHQYETDTSADLSALESDANVGRGVQRRTVASASAAVFPAAGGAAAVPQAVPPPLSQSRADDVGASSAVVLTAAAAAAEQPAAATLSSPSSPNSSDGESESGGSSDLDDVDGDGSADEVLEESYMPEEYVRADPAFASAAGASAAAGCWEEREPDCSQKVSAADLERQLLAYFTTNDQLYRRVLLYEPLDFDELLASVKSHGIRCSAAKLVNFCDDKCITYTMRKRSRTQDGKPISRQRRKPGGKKRA